MMETLAGEPLTLEQNPRWAAQTEAGKSREGSLPRGGSGHILDSGERSVLGPL